MNYFSSLETVILRLAKVNDRLADNILEKLMEGNNKNFIKIVEKVICESE